MIDLQIARTLGMSSINARLAQEFGKRPWWLNGVWMFCLYMTFIYIPFDFFTKPMADWEEVWFGFKIVGWSAKVSEIAHWLIYGAGAYGLWKLKPWLWPWITIYCGQVAVAMLVFVLLEGSVLGMGGLRGLLVGGAIFAAFAYLAWLLWKAKALAVEE